MRSYMPRKHREFLEALIRVAHIRDYVLEHAETTPELVISYDACLAMLRTFRDKHIQVVSRYIIIQARKAQRWQQLLPPLSQPAPRCRRNNMQRPALNPNAKVLQRPPLHNQRHVVPEAQLSFRSSNRPVTKQETLLCLPGAAGCCLILVGSLTTPHLAGLACQQQYQ